MYPQSCSDFFQYSVTQLLVAGNNQRLIVRFCVWEYGALVLYWLVIISLLKWDQQIYTNITLLEYWNELDVSIIIWLLLPSLNGFQINSALLMDCCLFLKMNSVFGDIRFLVCTVLLSFSLRCSLSGNDHLLHVTDNFLKLVYVSLSIMDSCWF